MSIKEIQKLTGFSYSTISRVLNGKAKEFRISDETRHSILEAAEKLRHRPNILARALRLKKTMSIGLIISDIQNPFFGELASKIESLLRKHGYSTFLCNANEIPENEEFYLQVLIDRQVDGIIISPIHTEEWGNFENIRKEIPIVLIDRIFYKTNLPWVTSDNTLAAEAITNELITLGYKQIAYLGGTPKTYINGARYKGYQTAFKKNSLKVNKNMVLFKGYSSDAGEEMMEKFFEQTPDIEAVFCVNNLVFFGAMKIVQKYESKHNRSIMMAAFDIGRYCNVFKRPLLSANQDLGRLARMAVSLMIDQIEDTPSRENQLIAPIDVEKYRIT